MAEPQVCSTDVMPILAPRVAGVGGDGANGLGQSPEQQVAKRLLV